ncbi:MAG: hypothetical protein ACRC92_18570 [Peptostreptococcaceae bacterium]
MDLIMNWLCLICVSLLVFEMMVYFCKDAIKIMEGTEKAKSRTVRKRRTYVYENKIAK